MALNDLFERSAALTRFPSTSGRRPVIASIGLVVVLLALISGAAPAMASSIVEGSQGMPVLAFKPAQPAAPIVLQVTGQSSSEIDLSWTEPASGDSAVSYNVYQVSGSGTNVRGFPPTLKGQPTDTTYAVTNLTSDTLYSFRVTAVDSVGEQSGYSNQVNAMTSGGSPAGGSAGGSSGESPAGGSSGGSQPGSPADSPAGLQAGGAPAGFGGSTGGSSPPWGVLGVLIPVIIGALILMRRRSQRKARTPLAASGQSVQAVAHAGPPGPVTINATGKGATLTVRVERHPTPGVITIEEVPLR